MEMIMSMISSAPASAQGAIQSPTSRSVAILRQWWLAHLRRRIERAAIAQLASMSDRELHDIGLTRSKIAGAVRGEEQLYQRYY